MLSDGTPHERVRRPSNFFVMQISPLTLSDAIHECFAKSSDMWNPVLLSPRRLLTVITLDYNKATETCRPAFSLYHREFIILSATLTLYKLYTRATIELHAGRCSLAFAIGTQHLDAIKPILEKNSLA